MLQQFILKNISEITDRDVLENISQDAVSLLITEDNLYYIEVLSTGEFFVNDGCDGFKTMNILSALSFEQQFISENN